LDQNSLNDMERLGLRILCMAASPEAKLPRCEDCNHPERRSLGRLAPAERRRWIRQTKRANGCIGPGARNKPHRDGMGYRFSDGEPFWICPRLYERDRQLVAYLETYLWYEHKGTMPVAGGLLDQPAKWVEAMEVIRTEFRRIERARIDQERKRSEREALAAKARMKGRRP
jgi:hypothetical protein